MNFDVIKKDKQFVLFYETEENYDNNIVSRKYDMNTGITYGKSGHPVKTLTSNSYYRANGKDLFSYFIANNGVEPKDFLECDIAIGYVSCLNYDFKTYTFDRSCLRIIKKCHDEKIDLTTIQIDSRNYLYDELFNFYVIEKLKKLINREIPQDVIRYIRNDTSFISDIDKINCDILLWIMYDVVPIYRLHKISLFTLFDIYTQAQILGIITEQHRNLFDTMKRTIEAEENASYDKVYEPFLDRIKYEDKNFYVDIPHSFKDLQYCSDELHNCVGRGSGYHNEILGNRGLIIFIKSKATNKIAVCCELKITDDNRLLIIQFLGFGNTQTFDNNLVAFRADYISFIYR